MRNDEHRQEQPTLWDELPPRPAPKAAPRLRAAPPSPRPIAPRRTAGDGTGERLLTAADLAEYLGVPVKTIYTWRAKGQGPKGFRLGKHLRWRVATVLAWSLDQEQSQ
ncbi:helix-turn-helix transcriptional regulator [Nocardioides sp. GCM10030258]|uniref:helix-turn-helix transcriptional regulator n=1 Tax=unclassified Nocardioides TaxID=2615069 RepID=UPI00361F4C4C